MGNFLSSKNLRLHDAALQGDFVEVRHLIANGAEIDSIEEGCTPLMCAAKNGHIDVVRFLLQQGAKTGIFDENKDTALLLASATADHGDIVQAILLADHDLDINFQNINGETALMRASFCGNAQVVNVLIEYEADMNMQNKNGDTCLHRAAFAGHRDIVDKLLQYPELKRKKENNKGETAYTVTTKSEVLEVFAKHGIDSDPRDD